MRRLFALLMTLTLAGCASLPTEIDVQSGPELIPLEQQEFAYYSPASPEEGASPQEIVSGFLAAGTGPQNDYSVAREYLSEAFATRWKPDAQTLVRVGVPLYQSAGENLQVVDITVGARVDENGRYQDLVPDQVSLRFQLAQEDGEWRITSAPNLTVVTLPVFTVVFSALPIYFLDTNSTQLVPDLRWFPSRASTATRLVNAVLAGPADWLKETVVSAIPTGTALTVNAVRIVDGVARVDFDANALEANARQRGLMLSQLRSTLLQLPGVLDVALSVNNSTQDINPATIPSPLGPTTTFALTAEEVLRLSGSEAGVVAGTDDSVAANQPSSFAAVGDGSNIALVGESGLFRLQRQGLGYAERQLSDSVYREIEFDRDGNLWAYNSNASSVTIYDRADAARFLETGLEGELVAGAVSPEGARVALLVASGEDVVVHLMGVLRDSTGKPFRLQQGLEFTPVLGDAISVAWQGLTNLRILERTASGLTALSEYPLTGPREQLNMPPAIGKRLESGSTLISSYLLTENAEVWAFSSNAWRRVSTEVLDISTGR
uniref:GerMN domain-containing protein n=1 Tax=Aquiluna sp. TaxID=2053504 RepID=UPI0040485AE0